MKLGRSFILPALVTVITCFIIILQPLPAQSTPDYARQTGFECKHCHVDVIGGGPLTQAGKDFLEDVKAKGLYRPLTAAQHYVRLIIGYLHLMAAIIWFGTIMYVHVL
jgi:hypothetical protein